MKLVTAFECTKTIEAWAEDERCQVSLATLRRRLRGGWEPEAALEYPPQRGKPQQPRELVGMASRETEATKQAQQKARDEATGVEELRRQIEEIQAVIARQREDLAQHKRSSIEWQRYALRCETQVLVLGGDLPDGGRQPKAWQEHLTVGQRAMYALELLPMFELEARQRQATSTGGASPQLRFNRAEAGFRARDQAAAMAGVSPVAVQRAKFVRSHREVVKRTTCMDLVAEIRAGARSLNSAVWTTKTVVGRLP